MTLLQFSRRRLLACLTVVCGAAAAGGGATAAILAARDPRIRQLTQLFRGRASARAVGAAYLRVAPGEAAATVLLDALLADDPVLAALLQSGDTPALHRHLALRVRDDFAAGRTVFVNRWLLSRTESRLCGLALFA